MHTIKLATLAAYAALAACGDYSSTTYSNPTPPQPVVASATGDITAAVNDFRTLLGPANTAAGEQPTGRREINWDGAGANPFDNRNDFPPDFFNTTVKAGAVFTTAGTGFRNDSTSFAEVNPAYAAQFSFFSPNKIFSPVGSNVLDVLLRVAGQPTPAVVRGFGVVFSDVDVANTTTVQLFAQDGSSLGTLTAPVRSDARGLSFVGVSYDQPVIARARITLGSGTLAVNVNDVSAGGSADLVVLDNVVYSEPRKAF
jgi:hypothetical protein